MDRKFTNKILQPRQAEVRRLSGDSIESAVSGDSGMYYHFAKSLKKVRDKVTGVVSSAINIMFPPSQISVLNRSPRVNMVKLPAITEFAKLSLPAPKPLHSDSSTSAPTPGRFDQPGLQEVQIFNDSKKPKLYDDANYKMIPFKPQDKAKLGTPIWKKYQFKAPEKFGLKKQDENVAKKIEIKVENKNTVSNDNIKSNNESDPQKNNSADKQMLDQNKTEASQKKKSFSEPNSEEKRPKLSERELVSQYLKSMYKSKQNSDEKKNLSENLKFSDSKAKPQSSKVSSELISSAGLNNTPITKPDKNNLSTSLTPKNIELTPEFPNNNEIKSSPQAELKNPIESIPSPSVTQETKVMSDKKPENVSFFVPENEKKYEEMEEGFKVTEKNSNKTQKLDANYSDIPKPTPEVINPSPMAMERDAINSMNTIKQNSSPVFAFGNKMTSNPFLSSDSVSQAKPVYVFGSSSSSNPFQSNPVSQPNPINNPFQSAPLTNPGTQPSPINNPFQPAPLTNPFQPTPLYSSNVPVTQPSPINNPFQATPQISNPFQTNPLYSSNVPTSQTNPINNPFQSTQPNNPFQPNPLYSSNVPNTQTNPINNPFSSNPINNPFQPTPLYSSNVSNPNPINPFSRPNEPPINPRPPLYGSSYTGRDVEMVSEAPSASFPTSQPGTFNIGSIPQRNIIRARRPGNSLQ
jgi:hypothetical protein